MSDKIQFADYSQGYGKQLAGPLMQAGAALAGAAGQDSLDVEKTSGGKGLIIGYWVFIVVILIYMIILAIIYYNESTKWKLVEDETGKKAANCGSNIATIYSYTKTSGSTTSTVYVCGDLLTEDEIVTWNIHKTVMNGLLILAGIYGITIFVFVGAGSGKRKTEDGKTRCVHGATQLGWYIVLCIIWFIVNMVWDIKNSQFKIATKDAEGFCGMTETFCGSISEGFSNVGRKLRRF